MAGHNEKRGQGKVPDQNGSCPVAVLAPERGVRIRENSAQPISAEPFVADRNFSSRGGYPISKEPINFDRAARQPRDNESHTVPIEALRQYELPVFICVHSGLMVFDVAGAEGDVISPAKKGVNFQKNLVQRLGAKRRLVDELVDGSYKQESGQGRVHEKRQ